ncbi:MAG: hypothetical protein LBR38_01015 [Synergistaceae bacterium]|nr:hypothetical protein [Synergistaceae bacterium]
MQSLEMQLLLLLYTASPTPQQIQTISTTPPQLRYVEKQHGCLAVLAKWDEWIYVAFHSPVDYPTDTYGNYVMNWWNSKTWDCVLIDSANGIMCSRSTFEVPRPLSKKLVKCLSDATITPDFTALHARFMAQMRAMSPDDVWAMATPIETEETAPRTCRTLAREIANGFPAVDVPREKNWLLTLFRSEKGRANPFVQTWNPKDTDTPGVLTSRVATLLATGRSHKAEELILGLDDNARTKYITECCLVIHDLGEALIRLESANDMNGITISFFLLAAAYYGILVLTGDDGTCAFSAFGGSEFAVHLTPDVRLLEVGKYGATVPTVFASEVYDITAVSRIEAIASIVARSMKAQQAIVGGVNPGEMFATDALTIPALHYACAVAKMAGRERLVLPPKLKLAAHITRGLAEILTQSYAAMNECFCTAMPTIEQTCSQIHEAIIENTAYPLFDGISDVLWHDEHGLREIKLLPLPDKYIAAIVSITTPDGSMKYERMFQIDDMCSEVYENVPFF